MKKQNNLQKFVEYSRLKNNPWLKFLLFVILLNSLITFAGVMIPRTIVVIIQNNSNSLMKILSFVCGLELALLLLKTISAILKGKLKNCSKELFRESYADLALKQSLLLYECSISSENLGLLEGGKYGIWEIPPLSNWLERLGSSIASILLNGVLVCIFDWKLLIVPVAIQILLRPFYRSVMKIEIDNAKRLLLENRAFGWYCRLVSDFRFGEDLRIYQASDLILDRCQKLMQKIYRINQKAYTHKGILLGIIKFLFQFQIVVVAVMLGFRCMKGMEIADFILLFSAISVISVASNDLVEGINRLKKMDALLDPFFKFIEQKEEVAAENIGSINEINGSESNNHELRFENVTFTYPGQKQPAISKVSFCISNGEKIGIFGTNGAGKSTVVKLLCKLYTPQSGKITIDGIDIAKLSAEECWKKHLPFFKIFKCYQSKSVRILHVNLQKKLPKRILYKLKSFSTTNISTLG